MAFDFGKLGFTAKDTKYVNLLSRTVKKLYETVGPAVVDPFGSMHKAIKDTPKVKAASNFFKSIAKMLPGPFEGIMSLMEQLGVLNPIFDVLSALFEYFMAQILVALMPVMVQLIEIMTSDEVISLLKSVAEIIAAMLVPALFILVMVFNTLLPLVHMIATGLHYVAEGAKWLIDLFAGLAEAWGSFWRGDLWGAIFDAWENFWENNEIWNALWDAWFKFWDNLNPLTSSGNGNGNDEGLFPDDWWLIGGLAEGTSYVTQEGPYWLHEGESVETAEETADGKGGGITIIIQGDIHGRSIIDELISELETRKALGMI